MLIFSRKLFLKKFRAHFHEASNKPFQKMNRDLEVPISFIKLKPCECLHYTIWRKYENSIFEAVKIKLNQLYVLFMHLSNLIVNYLYRKYGIALHYFFENWTRGTSHLKVEIRKKIKFFIVKLIKQ